MNTTYSMEYGWKEFNAEYWIYECSIALAGKIEDENENEKNSRKIYTLLIWIYRTHTDTHRKIYIQRSAQYEKLWMDEWMNEWMQRRRINEIKTGVIAYQVDFHCMVDMVCKMRVFPTWNRFPL